MFPIISVKYGHCMLMTSFPYYNEIIIFLLTPMFHGDGESCPDSYRVQLQCVSMHDKLSASAALAHPAILRPAGGLRFRANAQQHQSAAVE